MHYTTYISDFVYFPQIRRLKYFCWSHCPVSHILTLTQRRRPGLRDGPLSATTSSGTFLLIDGNSLLTHSEEEFEINTISYFEYIGTVRLSCIKN